MKNLFFLLCFLSFSVSAFSQTAESSECLSDLQKSVDFFDLNLVLHLSHSATNDVPDVYLFSLYGEVADQVLFLVNAKTDYGISPITFLGGLYVLPLDLQVCLMRNTYSTREYVGLAADIGHVNLKYDDAFFNLSVLEDSEYDSPDPFFDFMDALGIDTSKATRENDYQYSLDEKTFSTLNLELLDNFLRKVEAKDSSLSLISIDAEQGTLLRYTTTIR